MVATLFEETLEMAATRGCPQGRVLPLKLWSLVVDVLLQKLNKSVYYAAGYVDNVTTLIIGKSPSNSHRYYKQLIAGTAVV